MSAPDPNWCPTCKGFVIWSIAIGGPWCTCAEGEKTKAGLRELLDPLSDVGKALAGCAEQANKLFDQGKKNDG